MCVAFGCNPKINFVTFSQFELSHFLAQLLSIWTHNLSWFFFNFAGVFVKVGRCA